MGKRTRRGRMEGHSFGYIGINNQYCLEIMRIIRILIVGGCIGTAATLFENLSTEEMEFRLNIAVWITLATITLVLNTFMAK